MATATDAPPAQSRVAAAASAALPREVIDGGEIIILAIKPSMWRPLFDAGPWLVTCAAIASLMLWAGASIPGLPHVASVQIVLLVGLARLGVAIARWIPRWYVLTNRRVMHIRGVRAPQVDYILLSRVASLCMHRTFAEAAAGLATLRMTAENGIPSRLEWRSIASPQAVHDRVMQAIQEARGPHLE